MRIGRLALICAALLAQALPAGAFDDRVLGVGNEPLGDCEMLIALQPDKRRGFILLRWPCTWPKALMSA